MIVFKKLFLQCFYSNFSSHLYKTNSSKFVKPHNSEKADLIQIKILRKRKSSKVPSHRFQLSKIKSEKISQEHKDILKKSIQRDILIFFQKKFIELVEFIKNN